MEIVDILSLSHIAIDVRAASKKAVMEELARLATKNTPGLTPAQAFDSLVTRERLGSTGLDNGIAIPHGRVAHLSVMVGAFLRTKAAIDFDAIDGVPTDLFFALLVPEHTTDEHLNMLANLASIFSQERLVDMLRVSNTPQKIHEILQASSTDR